MPRFVAHRIALDPNNAQRTYFRKAAGVARFSYNWALAEWKRQYEAGGKPSDASLRRELTAIKREQFPWMFDVTSRASQVAIMDLGVAFQNFFAGRSKYPRFKSKGDPKSFCAATSGYFRTKGKRIKLPIVGWVRMREAIRFSGALKRATVSEEAGRWFVSIMIETDDIQPVAGLSGTVGVDLGVKSLAVLSTGETIAGPKALARAQKGLRRSHQALSRKQKGSKNWRKAKLRLARRYRKVAAIRRDSMHKLTTRIAKTFAVIGIEDLNVAGMLKNRRLARAVSDASFGMFRQQLTYKTEWYGSRLVVADRWYPSSKTCSCCGSVKAELALSQRVFSCDACNFEVDRDVNAARNLKEYAARSAASACGEIRAGSTRRSRVKRASVKQELGETAVKSAA